MACILTITVFAAPSAAGDGVYEKTIRLHVVANSDSDEDQQLKLLVRDRLLHEFSGVTKGCDDVQAAEKLVKSRLSDIKAAADDELIMNGCSYLSTAEIRNMHFDTRDYEFFSLPAGTYKTLYVVLGEGKGANWWCVLFPPLCMGSALSEVKVSALNAGLSEDEVALITDKRYEIRFKSLEIIDKIQEYFAK